MMTDMILTGSDNIILDFFNLRSLQALVFWGPKYTKLYCFQQGNTCFSRFKPIIKGNNIGTSVVPGTMKPPVRPRIGLVKWDLSSP